MDSSTLGAAIALTKKTTGELQNQIDEKLTAPQTAGTSGQVLVSDGNGGQVWGAIGQGDIIVDSTLSVSGAAADAAIVGNLKNDFNVLVDDFGVALDFTLSPGYIYGNGSIVSQSADKEVYTSAIPVAENDKLTIKVVFSSAVSLWLCYATYDSNGDFIERKRLSQSGSFTNFEVTITIPNGVSYVRVTYATHDVGSLTISKPWEKMDAIEERIETLEEDVDSVKDLAEINLQERIEMVVQNKSGSGPQLANIANYTLKEYGSSYKYYQSVIVDFTQNGSYYTNPVGKSAMFQVDAYDSNNTKVTSSQITIGPWDVLVRVDDTHIKRLQYTYESNFYEGKVRNTINYTLSGTASYLKIGSLKTLAFNDSPYIGVTYNKYSNVYMPYGANLQYNDEMSENVWDYFINKNRFYDLPSKRLNPWMQRSYALTHNLLDDRKINWVGEGTYYKMKFGETVPVIGGKTIICNKAMYSVKTYDNSGTETAVSNIGVYIPYTLASDVVAIRFDVWCGSGSHSIPENTYEPVVLYYADANGKTNPYDNVDVLPLPMAQINGWDINKNVYDYAVPDIESNIVRMMKTFAIREMNRTKDAFRIGTFNIYVNNTRTNRETVKKELETYGLDICAFQEARNLTDNGDQMNIGDYLKGWQFQYCNTNTATVTNGRSIASALQILSSTEVTFTDNTENSYLKCVIQMPRYKDYADGLTTLSLYTYHGNVSSATTRTAEVTQMLAAIAEDTSDFIIVTGDTNDFSTNKDIWAMFAAAGLTPVHDGKSETVTDRNNSLDNIFVSSHCSCAYYNVINSSEWMYIPAGGSTPQAVSDHDLVYADIVFDFETVIDARDN